MLLQQRINPITGDCEWIVVTADDEEQGDGDKTPSSLSQTSYLDMLNDTERNKAYEAAINRAVRSSLAPCCVLDIGAGTGLLSMMAARALQERDASSLCHGNKKPVIACEGFLPMFQLARKVIQSNGLSELIHLVYKRSEDIEIGKDMTSQADILVSEILDSTLLGEGLIPTLRHAHDVLLKPNAIVIPHKASIYGQLVQCDQLWRLHDLQSVETQLADGLTLHPKSFQGKQLFKAQQYPLHVNALMDDIEMMSEPFKVFEFDLSKKPVATRRVNLHIPTIQSGVIHAVISWWVLELDETGQIIYSTAPKWVQGDCYSWHDHWKQCVWFIPGEGLQTSKNGDIKIVASHDQISFQYTIGTSDNPLGSSFHNATNPKFQMYSMKPERIGLLGSSEWRSKIIAAMRKMVHGKPLGLCLVVDDSIPMAILAAVQSPLSVVALFPTLQSNDIEMLEILVEENGFGSDKIRVLQKKAIEVVSEDIGGQKVNYLIGEPFYRTSEEMLPWRNLRFWKERTCLEHLLSEDVVTMPCKGILYGMALSTNDLWKSRKSLKRVQGFNHSMVNATFGACGGVNEPYGGPILPCYIWQCGEYEELSEPFPIITFDFSKPIEIVNGFQKVKISKSGICHGIILWIDWVLDAESEYIVFTGPKGHSPTSWTQGVKLLPYPVHVDKWQSEGISSNSTSIQLSASFDFECGELSLGVEFE